MPEPRHWYLVLYDISDPKQQARVRKKLRAWGKSLQFSVFCVRSSEREHERLRWELAKLVDNTDRITYVRLCSGCAERVHSHGELLHDFDPADLPLCHLA